MTNADFIKAQFAKGLSSREVADACNKKGMTTKNGNSITISYVYKYKDAAKGKRKTAKEPVYESVQLGSPQGFCVYGSAEFLAEFIKRAS